MNVVLDAMTTTTGWSASGTASVYGLADWPEYVAGENTTSVIFKFQAIGDYVTKTITQTVSPYDTINLSLYSRENPNSQIVDKTDFAYKIDFGTGQEYYLPTVNGFTSCSIYVGDLTTLSRIRITALNTGVDYLIVSNIVLAKDDLPLDIFQGLKARVELEITTIVGDGTLLGTMTGLANDTYITMANVAHLARYTKIKIKDLTNTEYHYVTRVDGDKYYFSDLYSGGQLLHDYAGASVYLQYAVEYGRTENDIILPSVSIWGLASEQGPIGGNKLTTVVDTWKTTDVMGVRREGQQTRFNIMLDCEAHQAQNLALMSQAVRRVISKEAVWVNGIKYGIVQVGPAVEIEPTEAFEIIPKVQYSIAVDITEELAPRTFAVKIATTNFTATLE